MARDKEVTLSRYVYAGRIYWKLKRGDRVIARSQKKGGYSTFEQADRAADEVLDCLRIARSGR